jgi:uncharacterized protein YndB with AHSA1/START domain
MAQGQDTKTHVTTQIYEIYIRATPQEIWDAITTPEWTAKYGCRAPSRSPPRRCLSARRRMVSMGMPEVVIDGEVVEAIRHSWQPIGSYSRP